MINLSHWDATEEFSLLEAAALISGIDPFNIGEGDNTRYIYPVSQRLNFSCNLASESSLNEENSLALHRNTSGNLFRNEITRWINSVGIKSIYQFECNPSKIVKSNNSLTDTPLSSSNRWPWGEHHTEALGHLEAAAKRFWTRYDPSDLGTAPTNEMVSDWLQSERGASKEKAKAIASILRPDGLPTGPRK